MPFKAFFGKLLYRVKTAQSRHADVHKDDGRVKAQYIRNSLGTAAGLPADLVSQTVPVNYKLYTVSDGLLVIGNVKCPHIYPPRFIISHFDEF